MAVGGQANEALVGLDGVPVAGQLVLREAGCLACFKEHTFQSLVGEPVEAEGVVIGGCGSSQPLVGRVTAIV